MINKDLLKKLEEECLELLKLCQERWEKYRSDIDNCETTQELSQLSADYMKWYDDNINSQGLYIDRDQETGKPIIIGIHFWENKRIL